MNKLSVPLPNLKFSFLVVFEKPCALLKIFPQCWIFKGKIINLGFEWIKSLNGLFVPSEKKVLLSQIVILFIQELDLIGKFSNRFFVCLMGVLHTEDLQTWPTLV